MAVDALLAVLEREARAEADARLDSARERAGAVVAAARAEAARRVELARERLAEEERREVLRQTAGAVRSHREQRLAARVALLDRIFSRVEASLAGAPVSRYAARLPAYADEALVYLEGRPAVVVARSVVTGILRPHLEGRPDVTMAPDETVEAGLVARSADGEVMVPNTLPARLARRRADLAIALLRRLDEAAP